MDWPLTALLDDVLLQVSTSSPQRVLFWGEGAGGISSYVAGWMAGKGMDVILLDGANHFNPYMVSSFARKALISPEGLLKRIRIARAFTCYQMATLIGEKLTCLLGKEGIAQGHKPWVILLGPITTFLDEDVPEREVGPLFERSLRKVEPLVEKGIPFFIFQPLVPSHSKRAYLMRRLFQFSNLVWRIHLGDQGPKVTLEKEFIESNGIKYLAPHLGKSQAASTIDFKFQNSNPKAQINSKQQFRIAER